MTARDDLAGLILPLLPYSTIPDQGDADTIADAILAAGWRDSYRIWTMIEDEKETIAAERTPASGPWHDYDRGFDDGMAAARDLIKRGK